MKVVVTAGCLMAGAVIVSVVVPIWMVIMIAGLCVKQERRHDEFIGYEGR